MDNNILYIAVVLDDRSSTILKKFLYNNIGGEENVRIYCHHMTVAFKNSAKLPLLNWVDENEGKIFNLKPKAIGKSNKAIALAVETECPSVNSVKHITLCTLGDGRPVDSNYISPSNWVNVPKGLENIILTGKLTKIYKH